MKQGILWSGLVLTLCAGTAAADTIHLNNGVSVDGTVKQRDGYIEVDAGGRKVFYRDNEIASIEKNEKTGKIDLAERYAYWQTEEEEMLRKTGLTAEQRRRVGELIDELPKDPATRMAAREKLMALQSEMNVYRYLAFLLPHASHFQVPALLEAMAYLDSSQAIQVLRAATQNNYFEARAKAIELLGGLTHKASVDLISRGLADDKTEVQIQAAYALARIGAQEATPALIDLLKHPDLRVSNASRESLRALWPDQLGDGSQMSVDEWTAIWKGNEASVSGRIQLALLQPLVVAEEEFQNE